MPGPDSSSFDDGADRLGSGVQASWHDAPFTNPVRLDRVDSTHRYLRDAALEGAPEGLVVLAEEQLAGRGRRDRTWAAPHGSSLLCSMLFRPRFPPDAYHLLPSAVGLAALDALAEVAQVRAGLKWPNDVLAGDLKIAGILAEVVGTTPAPGGSRAPAVIVGLGMNVAWPAGWPPPGPAAESVRGATTVERVSPVPVDRERLGAALLAAVERRYARLERGPGRTATAREYSDRCVTVGRQVRVVLEASAVEGRATEVDAEGRLVVALAEGERRFAAGDVVHLR